MAGEINWGLLDTRAPERAANAFYEGQQQQQKNALMVAQMQGLQRQNKLADLAMRDDEATRSAYQASGGDMTKALSALQQGGQYKAAVELQTRMSAQQKDSLAVKKSELENHLKTFETVGQIMSGVRDQASYDAARQQMAQVIGPEAAAKAPPQYDPAFIEQQRTKAMSVKDQLANQWKAIGAQLDQDKFAETKTNNLRVDARTVRGQNMTDARAKETANGVESAFSPEAISNAAARYNIDGTLPPMGMGKSGSLGRAAILNEAANQASSSGVSPDDQRIAQIGNKANTAALSKIQQQQTMVGAFEKNFNRNADIALEQSSKVDRTGVPLANKWINAGKRSITGDPEISAFDASVKAVSNEYAKIISGSMGNTAMAEGEIKKVEGLLNAAQTPDQLKSVIGMMKRETANRMKGFDEEKSQLRGTMGRRNTDKPSAPENVGGKPALADIFK